MRAVKLSAADFRARAELAEKLIRYINNLPARTAAEIDASDFLASKLALLALQFHTKAKEASS